MIDPPPSHQPFRARQPNPIPMHMSRTCAAKTPDSRQARRPQNRKHHFNYALYAGVRECVLLCLCVCHIWAFVCPAVEPTQRASLMHIHIHTNTNNLCPTIIISICSTCPSTRKHSCTRALARVRFRPSGPESCCPLIRSSAYRARTRIARRQLRYAR